MNRYDSSGLKFCKLCMVREKDYVYRIEVLYIIVTEGIRIPFDSILDFSSRACGTTPRC